MKKIINLFASWVLIAMLLIACSPEDMGLGSKDVRAEDLVEGIAFSITPDTDNPNIIYLESKMSGEYTPLWITPQGRSQEKKVTLRIPFAGKYEVTFGVETRGGVVYGEAAGFNVEDMCADFISDPLWTMLAGGGGNSKTWYLDLDADGVSRYALAPMYFFTANYCWDNLHNAAGGNYLDSDPWDAASAIVPNLTDGAATWYWLADWPGNSWMCAQADFGTMTFDLIDGAHVVTDQESYGLGISRGTYLLDTDNHTIKFSDAWPLSINERNSEVTGNATRTFNILYLSDDFMQLLIPETGTCFNYISKEYRDNWVPAEKEDPEPVLPDGWKDDVSQTVNKTIVWKLSENNPLDWCGLDGSRMNGWNAPSDYPDWLGTPDPSVYGDFAMALNSEEMTAEFTAPDGTKSTVGYTLDEKGIYTFDGQVPSFSIIGWASFAIDGNNQLRIMSIEKDALGSVTGMWLGAKDASKPEYVAYHLIPSAGGNQPADPTAAVKKLLCAKTWKLDSDRTYSKEYVPTVMIEGPVVFSDLATWAWNPPPGEHAAAGNPGVDYGTMKFEEDGSVTVQQWVEEEGTPGEMQTLTGTWDIDLDNNKLNMSIGMLHPWSYDYAVANWGDVSILKIEKDDLLLQVMRSAELSGEDAMLVLYVFVPSN